MAGRFAKLTPQAISQLPVGQTIREHGIRVEKLPGDARFYAEFMHHRRRVHRCLGLASAGWTIKKAEARVSEIKAEIHFGVCSLPAGRKTQLRFDELADWYLAEMEATGGKNLSNKRPQLQRRLRPYFRDHAVERITEEHVGRYVTAQQRSGMGVSTINRDLATLSHIFSTAVRRKKLSALPCRIPRQPEPQGRIRVLTDEEIAALCDAAASDVNPDLWLFVQFGLNTGMRASEIVSARFEMIDWHNHRLFLPKAKSGERHQPLTRHLCEVLRQERESREDKDGWIFPARFGGSRTGRAYAFNKPFERAVTAAGLGGSQVTPHVMRHTAITRLVEQGVPLPTIQKISGHKTLSMVLRYTHVTDRHVDEAMAALDGQLRRNIA